MVPILKLARRLARFRAIAAVSVLFGAAACDNDRMGPAEAVDQVDAGVTSTVAFAGIPIGLSAQPATAFGPLYNGAKLALKTWEMMPALAAIQARGGRVLLALAGNPQYFRDAAGNFDLNMWKARVDRFRRMNLAPYIKDGTIFGNFLVDEPNDSDDWNGKAIPPSTLEAMAKYSKDIWPTLPTIVRVESSYLTSGTYRYLDAAWASYVSRKGNIKDFLKRNVDGARQKGLALVVGLNVLKGGANQAPLTATQVKTWGTELLSSTYPCAFISWEYEASFLASTAMRDAMLVLRDKAQNRAAKTCRRS